METRCRVLLTAALFVLAGPAGSAAPRLAHLGILTDVHGYDTGNGVVVPVRGIAEWLGATVDFAPPVVRIHLGATRVSLTLGSSRASVNGREVILATPPRVYGDVTCAPLRFVAEALGIEVAYATEGEMWDRIGSGPIVVLKRGGETAVVLVHRVDPGVVTQVVTNLVAEGRFGADWVMAVLSREGDYAYGTEPRYWVTDSPAAPGGAYLDTLSGEGADVILAHREGKWRPVYFPGGVAVSPRALAQAGVPISVARRLGVPIEPE